MSWGAFLLAAGIGLVVSSLCALNGFDHAIEDNRVHTGLVLFGIIVAAIGAGLLAA